MIFGGESDAATRYIAPTLVRLSHTDALSHKVMQGKTFDLFGKYLEKLIENAIRKHF